MITIKTPTEIAILREGGRRLAYVLDTLVKAVRPGVTAKEIDVLAEKLVRKGGDTPSFLHYRASGAKHVYPASLCVSINDKVVHGVPTAHEVIREGDLVSLDMGLVHKRLFVDSAVTIGIGSIDERAQELLDVTKGALAAGISAANAGKYTGDIGYVIEEYIKPHKFGIVRDLAGHGVGYAVHEDPFIPNYGTPGQGVLLKPGMVIAIEPMVNEGGDKIKLDKDGFTIRTADGSRSAHAEHTVLITPGPAEILTWF